MNGLQHRAHMKTGALDQESNPGALAYSPNPRHPVARTIIKSVIIYILYFSQQGEYFNAQNIFNLYRI